jgi:hypothetical protein
MPFVKQERRKEIDRLGVVACSEYGDICYYFYKLMVDRWKKEPRWSTAHIIYRDFILDDATGISKPNIYWSTFDLLQAKFDLLDVKAALDLAWQVFFQKYVMPYEDLKENENGTI